MTVETDRLRRLAGLLEDMGAGAFSAHVMCAVREIEKLRADCASYERTAQIIAMLPPELERVRHKKRGTEYEVLGEAEAQVSVAVDYTRRDMPARLLLDGEKLTVYRDPQNGKLWCRFTDEMRDGRFEPSDLSNASAA